VLSYDSRTAGVYTSSADDNGTIYMEEGQLRHAQTRTLVGEAAFRAMMRWQASSFSVNPDARTDNYTIHTPLMNLLLDQAVLEDEAAYFGSAGAGS
jgi:hypothetical protein